MSDADEWADAAAAASWHDYMAQEETDDLRKENDKLRALLKEARPLAVKAVETAECGLAAAANDLTRSLCEKAVGDSRYLLARIDEAVK